MKRGLTGFEGNYSVIRGDSPEQDIKDYNNAVMEDLAVSKQKLGRGGLTLADTVEAIVTNYLGYHGGTSVTLMRPSNKEYFDLENIHTIGFLPLKIYEFRKLKEQLRAEERELK